MFAIVRGDGPSRAISLRPSTLCGGFLPGNNFFEYTQRLECIV
jgi:hypothetical protein